MQSQTHSLPSAKTKRKANPKQIAAFHETKRNNLILAGRRGGKTFVMLERCLRKLAYSKKNAEVYYIGPTNQSSKELAWDFFQNRIYRLGWECKPLISRQVFLLPDDRKLYVIGAEKIERIRGHKVWHVAMDEVAYYSKSLSHIWKAVRPALSDLKGTADFGTTPNGKGSDAHDWFQYHKGNFGWAYHHWTSLENPWLDPKEIEDAKRDLDEKAFRQEYEATWETYEGLAYYNFNDDTHVKPCSTFTPGVPLHLVFDFNVNPTTLLVSQFVGDKMYYRREYSFADSSTERTIKAFITDYKDLSTLPVKIRGDASGNQRKSTTGRTDYQYIHEALTNDRIGFHHEVPSVNPPIIDRLNAVNGWLKPLVGEPKIIIDPSCKYLIKDLGGQKLEGRHPSPANNLGHKADALGYDIFWQHMLSKRPQSIQTRY
jgi:hypothetical protein